MYLSTTNITTSKRNNLIRPKMGISECQIKVTILVKHPSAENKNTSSKN